MSYSNKAKLISIKINVLFKICFASRLGGHVWVMLP